MPVPNRDPELERLCEDLMEIRQRMEEARDYPELPEVAEMMGLLGYILEDSHGV